MQTSQFTIGKLDAGIAVLLGEGSHLVEFPSVLLPQGCKPGSIVSISCERNTQAEQATAKAFWDLQDLILDTFGKATPAAPVLKLRNVTQTAVALEWEPLQLATAKLLNLTIWRNSQRLAVIPNPLTNTSTKVSGLDIDAPYSFHLVAHTTAGTWTSNVVKTRTHRLDNTTGIRVCFGNVQPPELLDACHDWLEQMGASATEALQIDTTHFVCTGPGSSSASPNGSQLYQRALQISIPTIVPAWLEACANEKRLAAVKNFTLGGKGTPNSSVPASYRAGSASASRASLSNASTSQTAAPQAADMRASGSQSTAIPEESEPATAESDATAVGQPKSDLPEEGGGQHQQQEGEEDKTRQKQADLELHTPADDGPADEEVRAGAPEDRADDERSVTESSAGDMEDVKL